MLSKRELARYGRQILIPEWAKAGQQKLKKAKVVVAGAGGLGSPVLTYLAVAGVGKLRVIDCDKVELGNLNRQILHWDKDIGRAKVDSAKEKLESLNPDIEVEAINERITEDNVFELVEDYAIVDAIDDLSTRFLLNRAALRKNLPLFHGAIYGFEGRATTIIPGKTSCLRCLYQEMIPGPIPVVGVTPAVIGCIQATMECLHALEAKYPDLKRLFYDKQGVLLPRVMFFVNDQRIHADELNNTLKDGDELLISLAIGGA